MRSEKVIDFHSMTDNVGKFDLREKMVLVPEMSTIGSRILAAAFRGFGIQARVLETCKGLDLGMEYTSGKECYPCQITMGDILYFLKQEQKEKAQRFNPDQYIYFMPEAEGPCRFGMYNKYQRIILDSFPEFQKVRISSITTGDGYSLAGMVERDQARDLRKASYLAIVIGDILDRLLWRIRPYEKEAGVADDHIRKSIKLMEDSFEGYAGKNHGTKILDKLEQIVEEGKALIDPAMLAKPLVGIVGEIYLRSHVHANQDLIRMIERHGGEVVNASIAEWVNYTSYEGFRAAKKRFSLKAKQYRFRDLREEIEKIIRFGGELQFQQFRQKQAYKRAKKLMDLATDHSVSHLDKILEDNGLYTFDAGTEACLSIAGIEEYVREGYNGIINVFPFTCMPSTITSAIVKPLMNRLRIPYLDTPYDASQQPGRETAIRTFMYQAHQHLKTYGRKAH
jgi:predicted nucleotide-binding protein (sugar kinase/HSP70/actin superfamily)